MNAAEIVQAMHDGRAVLVPSIVYNAARPSNGKPARLTLAVDDALLKRLSNQRPDERDLFVLVRIPAEVKRAAEAGLILPGAPR